MKNTAVMLEDFERINSFSFIEWEKFRDQTILVTGATGLIGMSFVKAVLHVSRKQGLKIRVIALFRNLKKAEECFCDECGDANLVFMQSDVRELPAIEGKVDYIVHCASVTASKYMVTNPTETLLITVEGTKNILELAKNANVKGVVYLSSMEMYGYTEETQNPVTEEKLGYINILNVRSCYPEGKRAAECLCHAYAREYGVPVSIARLAQTFGAGVGAGETRVFAYFAKSALRHEDIVLHTKGQSVGNYCYTADVVSALLCLLTKGSHGEAYNVANEQNSMRICEMADLVCREVSGGTSKIVFDIPEDALKYGYAQDTNLRLSAEKLRGLGWFPQYALGEMYQRMIKSWNEAGETENG